MPESVDSAIKGPEVSRSKAEVNAARRRAVGRLYEVSKPEMGFITWGMAALVVNSVTNMSYPWIMGMAVDQMGSKASGKFGGTASIRFPIMVGSIFTIGSIASCVRVYLLGTSTDRIASRLRGMVFDSYLYKEMAFFEEGSTAENGGRTGDMVSLLSDDAVTAAELFTDKLAAGMRSLNSSLAGSVFLFVSSPSLAAVTLSIVPVVGIGAMTLSRYSRRMKEQLRLVQAAALDFAIERFQAISVVRLNGQEAHEQQRYQEFAAVGLGYSRSACFAQGMLMSFLNAAVNVSLVGVLFVGGRLIARGKMTAGDLAQFAMRSSFVGLGFSGLSTFYSDCTRAADAAERVFRLVDGTSNNPSNNPSSDASSSPDPNPSATVEGGVGGVVEGQARKPVIATKLESLPGPKQGSSLAFEANSVGCLRLENVSFGYLSRLPALAVRNVSLVVAPCTFVGIIGQSGAGKSTLFSLAAGLYHPTAGRVMLDGSVVTSVTSSASSVGMRRCM